MIPMKYLVQFGIILVVCFLGNFLHKALDLPMPGSVIGMLLLFFFLLTGILKLSMVEDVSNFLLKHLSFFFVPAGVGLITCFSILHGKWIPLIIISIVSTIIIAVTTGLTVQILMKRRRSGE